MASPSSFPDDLPPGRWLARGAVALVVVALLAVATAATLAYVPPRLQPGTVSDPANGSTVVAVQGFHFAGIYDRKKPARLVSLGERARVEWIYRGGANATWFYDVDPLPNGNLLVVNPVREGGRGKTLVYALAPGTRERVWQETFAIADVHDVDAIGDDRLLVAAPREWDAANGSGVSNDRIFVYDRSTDEVVWTWYFRRHYPASLDGGPSPDWTHVNDVDRIGPGRYLVSPRNFDQVIVVNRSTGAVTLRLGADGNHAVLEEQHDPTYLETAGGKPVLLVADSGNDRVVEYTCVERRDGVCRWERTWVLGTGGLTWPRDADRLPNGNTLIVDSLNHRVIEVTPRGRIVWEAYVPWAPYDAERIRWGDEGVRSPTMYDLGVNGTYSLHGSAGLTAGTRGGGQTLPEWLQANLAGVPVVGGIARGLAVTWQAGAQWIKPVWLSPWGFVYATLAALLLVGWGLAEVAYRRRAILAVLRRGVARLR